ncbi:DUF58 domain-containing protein [Fimbriimonas ginsengisoli]|uniref:DUF58 domain-containing protein n=1 Tax=Fimbriimonas ginsengisoli Gsoil 348 TaxID=661478 RepID=A0A068NKG2_FIMGI|nr:DUF58 domain-containing protein [Fimbriimonas ginsengisoli]AIE83932.1 hypothetical protein OP10G_0564 [Fimbriimonas ginsengisoli Gsoil 348]
MTQFLLEPREFRLLDGMRLNPRKSFPGRVRGERLTRKKGISIEFADYREYSEGDDLRHLDWNVLARLDSPVMRTYQDEEDLAVHLLLDLSPSMEFGEPSKLAQARRLACAVGYIALSGGDAVLPRALGPREPNVRALRGRAGFPRLSQWAETARPPERNRDSLAASLRGFVNAGTRTGIALLVSDGMDPEAATAIRSLGGRGHEVWFLQVLSDIELDPDLEGDLRLLDAESGSPVEITANSYVLKEYRKRLEEHNNSLVEAVRRVGGRHALIRADEPLEAVIKNVLKRDGWTQ